jgi:L-alanine-DL-glutamate epimerase-like enolase superfamily enzyme
LGSHLGAATLFAAIEGEDPRAVTALYDRMLRQTFKAGHAGALFGTIGAMDTALWDIKGDPSGRAVVAASRRPRAHRARVCLRARYRAR